MSGLILYTTDDGRSQIKLRAKDQTVWLSQREMALHQRFTPTAKDTPWS